MDVNRMIGIMKSIWQVPTLAIDGAERAVERVFSLLKSTMSSAVIFSHK